MDRDQEFNVPLGPTSLLCQARVGRLLPGTNPPPSRISVPLDRPCFKQKAKLAFQLILIRLNLFLNINIRLWCLLVTKDVETEKEFFESNYL